MKKILALNICLIFFSALHAQQTKRVAPIGSKPTDLRVDSVTQIVVSKDTTVKKTTPKKPYNQLPKKPAEATEVKRNH